MKRIAATLILLLFATTAIAEEKVKSAIELQTEAAYGEWVKAVEAKDLKAVDALYAENVEMMTSSNKGLIKTKEDRDAMFQKLFKTKDLRVMNKRKVFDLYNDTTPIMSGICTFTYMQDGKSMRMPARFSFIYEKNKEGKLLISKQHFSSMPL